MMVEVKIDSVRVSLMSQHRIVVLKEADSARYLPIWIGPFEADAITIELQGVEVARPLTHDLLKTSIEKLGAEIQRVAITDLRNDTFYAEIGLQVDGRRMAIDSRPSDAIALAVRARVPIYVDSEVMEQAAIIPEPDLEGAAVSEGTGGETKAEAPEAFRDFLAGLDLTGLE
jgi:bifunctional DNase/RNase